MILCDYKNDLGLEFNRIKPLILGRNLSENLPLNPKESIGIISAWVSVDSYYEVPSKAGTCKSYGRLRRLIYQDNKYLIEAEYPEPFDLDWDAINSEGIKIKVEPEFLNHPTAMLLLKLKY